MTVSLTVFLVPLAILVGAVVTGAVAAMKFGARFGALEATVATHTATDATLVAKVDSIDKRLVRVETKVDHIEKLVSPAGGNDE